MARDGSGNYSLPAGNPVVTGTTVSSTTHNSTMTDIASALTASIAKDGQTTPSANLPMGGYKHTAVADGTARDQYAAVGQLQDAGALVVGSVSGTDTITGSLTPAIASYATGMIVILFPSGANTGATTLALNGLAAKSIRDVFGSALKGGELRLTNPAVLVYNGTYFVLVSEDAASGSFTGTLTGCTTSPTATINWYRTGNLVTLYFTSNLQATSNSTSMTVTGIPASLRPTTSVRAFCAPDFVDNGQSSIMPYALINSSGVATFIPLFNFFSAATFDDASWTTSGTKGVAGGASLTYPII